MPCLHPTMAGNGCSSQKVLNDFESETTVYAIRLYFKDISCSQIDLMRLGLVSCLCWDNYKLLFGYNKEFVLKKLVDALGQFDRIFSKTYLKCNVILVIDTDFHENPLESLLVGITLSVCRVAFFQSYSFSVIGFL